MTPVIMWFRRDLRFADHPALAKASRRGPVVALFVVDPALTGPAGPARLSFLAQNLADMDARLRTLGGHLVLRHGRPEDVVPQVVAEAGATEVHVSADFAPYGAARDERVAAALAPVPLVATGSPYAVSPPRLTTTTGTPYKVFTPYFRAWRSHGWPDPADSDPDTVTWAGLRSDPLWEPATLLPDTVLPVAGEDAARQTWARFRAEGLDDYATARDRPDLDGTSGLSPYLRFGALHPRTLLAELGDKGERFMSELAWREFYGSVLWHWPESARADFDARMSAMPVDEGPDADALFAAWCDGRTGYPIIDAGMRQLKARAWMHNRVRMLTASFLVKDLHLDWRRGARHFMRHLVDGDLASNQHGWQWTAGTGTDASPYFRIFNPVTQAKRFDPEGAYVRRWVPELADVQGRFVHEPWRAPDGVPADYVTPIVDHDVERRHSLAAYEALRRPGR
ncbi:MAG TPA: deoxyribodipyrimidine photo-lyase [Acidimicrobiales bacterium]|nr:deoxyribodipyrimidine photo-lyase [Acidimicrobiales bacterium]